MPQSWVICKLTDVCYFESGYAFSSDDYCQSGTPLVRISNIIDSRISLESCVYINSKCDIRFHVKKGDLLIAMSGATTGKMGVYDSDETAFLNQRVGNIKVINENVLLNEYRNIFMYSQIDYILELAYGGAQPNISANIICNLPIPIPSIEEQKRIVTAVGKWFSLIDTLETAKEVLQTSIVQAKSKILDLAIHGKLVPQDPNDEPAIDLLKRINPKFTPCDNAHYPFDIPSTWCLVDVKNIIYNPSSKPFQILQSDINERGITPVVSQSANYIEGYSDKKDCVFHNENAVLIFGDHTRNLKYVDFDFIVGADGVKIIIPYISVKYSYYALLRIINGMRNRGYARHYSILTDSTIPIPPHAEQLRIVAKIEKIFAVLDEIQKSIEA